MSGVGVGAIEVSPEGRVISGDGVFDLGSVPTISSKIGKR